jgi:DNA invertase Pin-like site-specific DNA recombinase
MSKRAVLYLRTGSRTPTNEVDRLAWQREVTSATARRLDAEVVAEYVDQGCSGMNPNRPDLQRLLAELPQLEPAYVLIADRSRLARNAADHAALVRRIEQSDAALVSALADFDPSVSADILALRRKGRDGSPS